MINLNAWIVFSIAGLLSIGNARAENADCTVGPPEAILRPSAVKAGTHRFKMQPPKTDTAPQANEMGVLPSGTPVAIESGGCAHWGEIYRFTVMPSAFKKGAPCTTALATAAILMREIASASEKPAPRNDYAKILSERSTQKAPYSCGELLALSTDVPDYGTIAVSTGALQLGKVPLEIRVQINP